MLALFLKKIHSKLQQRLLLLIIIFTSVTGLLKSKINGRKKTLHRENRVLIGHYSSAIN
jgi:hypothetical protein